MVFCISIFAVCLLLMFVCLVSVVADPSSCNFKEWVHSVLADTVGSILFRYLGCAFVVAGMTFSIGAYAAEEGPGEDPTPVVTESAAATSTPAPSLGDDHAPEDPVITMPPDYSPPAVVTSEPYITDPPQEAAPEPEVTPPSAIYTPGNENGSPEGELQRENSTSSNTPVPTSRPVAPGGGTFGGPEIFDPVSTVEPTPVIVGEYMEQLIYDVEYIEGLLCFIVVVILCYFSYKFFRIFF